MGARRGDALRASLSWGAESRRQSATERWAPRRLSHRAANLVGMRRACIAILGPIVVGLLFVVVLYAGAHAIAEIHHEFLVSSFSPSGATVPSESELYAGETVNGLAPLVFLAGAGYAVVQLVAPEPSRRRWR